MSVYLPNNYRIAWNCNSVIDRDFCKELAQNWANDTGKEVYVPDLGVFSPAGDPPDPDPGPDFAPLVVGRPTISGDPVVGYTLTCPEPSIQGGSGDLTINYYWQDADFKRILYMGGSHELTEMDLARTVCGQVYVADNQTGESATVESTNCLGPIVRPDLDGYDFFVDGQLHDTSTQLGLTPGASVVFEIKPKGNASHPPKDVTFDWSIRTGTGRLSGDTDKAAVVYIANDTAPSGALVQCQYSSQHADDVGVASTEVLVSSLRVDSSGTWKENNSYAPGTWAHFKAASFAGPDAASAELLWRSQRQPAGDDNWWNSNWTAYTADRDSLSFKTPDNGIIRFECKAVVEGESVVYTSPTQQVVNAKAAVPVEDMIKSSPKTQLKKFVSESDWADSFDKELFKLPVAQLRAAVLEAYRLASASDAAAD